MHETFKCRNELGVFMLPFSDTAIHSRLQATALTTRSIDPFLSVRLSPASPKQKPSALHFPMNFPLSEPQGSAWSDMHGLDPSISSKRFYVPFGGESCDCRVGATNIKAHRLKFQWCDTREPCSGGDSPLSLSHDFIIPEQRQGV